uniref:Uncharacterized protein n=1 Tax=Rhipicephalus zambeziensis TaxID=60191 RepID=A0A224Z2C2_9ACAR
MSPFRRNSTSFATCLAPTRESVLFPVPTASHPLPRNSTSWTTYAPTQENVPFPASTAMSPFRRNSTSFAMCLLFIQRKSLKAQVHTGCFGGFYSLIILCAVSTVDSQETEIC